MIHRLADLGNTVVVIEHNLEVIKTADWVIDLGPEAGLAGGDLVAEGTPEAIVQNPRSLTGRFLKPVLTAGPLGERPKFRLMGDPRTQTTGKKSDGKAAIPRATSLPAGNGKKPSEPALSAEAKAPWELDGRQWHTRDRVAGNGRPKRWDGRILETVVARIEALGGVSAKIDSRLAFAAADWSQRNIVRINVARNGQAELPVLPRHDIVRMGRPPAVLRPEEYIPAPRRWRSSSSWCRSTRVRPRCSPTILGSSLKTSARFKRSRSSATPPPTSRPPPSTLLTQGRDRVSAHGKTESAQKGQRARNGWLSEGVGAAGFGRARVG